MRFAIESATIPNMRTRLNTDVAGLAYVTSFAGIGGVIALPLAAVADRFDSDLSSRIVLTTIINVMLIMFQTRSLFGRDAVAASHRLRAVQRDQTLLHFADRLRSLRLLSGFELDSHRAE